MIAIRSLTALTLALGLAAGAAAADYPASPVRLVVGFPPGGGTDGAARIVAERLPAALGQPVIVENRAGAGGTLGAQAVARAAADGYTLFFGTGAEMLINPITRKQAPYDVLENFTPIGEVGSVSFVMVVPAGAAAKDVADLVKQAKAKPGHLNFASFGIGSTNHMIGELFLSRTGTSATHVPYQGSAPAMSALLAGDVDYAFETAAVALPQIKAGKLRALATPSPTRLRDLPDVPTLQELGYPGLVAEGWMGVFAPAATPPTVVDKVNRALAEVMKTPDVQERMAVRGVNVVVNTPAEFRTWLAQERDKWRKVAQESNIALD